MSFQLVKLLNPINMTISGTFTPKGAYDNATDYAVGDHVDYQGSSYVMYTDAAAGTLPTDSTKWGLLAEKGADGTTGSAGADGEGVAIGGTTGQVLSKIDATDYNTEWTTPLVFRYAGYYLRPNFCRW